jgi:hypothetical protein
VARERAVSAVVSRLGLTEPGAADTLADAHDVVWEYLRPFVVRVANDIIEDLSAEVVERVVAERDAGTRRTRNERQPSRLGPAGSHRRVPSRAPVRRGGSDRGPAR